MSQEMRKVGFSSVVRPNMPVEIADYTALVGRMGADHFAVAQRSDFGMMMLVTGGRSQHTVDFDQIDLVSGRLVFVRPGQVQQWHVGGAVEAKVVLARAELCRASGWFPGSASVRDLDVASLATAVDVTTALEREQERFIDDAVSVRLVSDLFSVMVGVFERATSSTHGHTLPEAYLAYRSAIEADLGHSRDARWFIARIGYSEKTVARACRLSAGLTAKEVLDERIMLEARRLLAHTETPVGRIGVMLGFGEASNFNRFFVRLGGLLPTEFRSQLRARGFSAGITP